jgi:apolipoprotein N-acyltransferase
MLPEHRDAFVDRARGFAREHGIYLASAYLVFAYGQTSGDNGLLMITPAGDVAYTYTKTKSWYATDSDGILRTVDTPFGRVSTAICFDMDFPGFIRQAAQQGVDIMLVPGFDTAGTRPYHSEVSLMRAVDYGFSVVRQVNEGASMATDYLGNVVAYQDFFAAQDRVLLADVPVRGTQTLYGMLGDYFPWVCVAAGMGFMTYAAMGASVAGRHAPAPGGRRASSAATSPR